MGYKDQDKYLAAVNDFNSKKATFGSKGDVINYLLETRAFDVDQIFSMARGWEREAKSGKFSGGVESSISTPTVGTGNSTPTVGTGTSAVNPNFANKYTVIASIQNQHFKTDEELLQYLMDSGQLNATEISSIMEQHSRKNSVSPAGEKIEDENELREKLYAYESELQSANNLLGAKSYEEYLKSYGVDSQRGYAESVRTANDAYYRALATYGKSGEGLAGAGLSGSGVSDYGGQAAWAARQGAVASAGAVKQQTDIANSKNYASYLSNFRAQAAAENEARRMENTNAINATMSMGMTDADQTRAYLAATGRFTEDQLDYLSSTMSGYFADRKAEIEKEQERIDTDTRNRARNDVINRVLVENVTDLEAAVSMAMASGAFESETEARKVLKGYVDYAAGKAEVEKKAVDEANAKIEFENTVKEAGELYDSYLSQNASPELALKLIGEKYDGNVVDAVREEKETIRTMVTEEAVNRVLSNLIDGKIGEVDLDKVKLNDVSLASVKGLESIAEKGSAAYNTMVENVQNHNAVVLSKLFETARDDYQWEDVASYLEIEATDDAEMVTAVHDKVIEMTKNGELSAEGCRALLTDYYSDELEGAKNAGRDVKLQQACANLVQAKIDAGKLGDDSIYENAIDALIEHVDIQKTEGVNGSTYDIIFGGEKAININDAILLGAGNGLAQEYPVTVIKENSKKGIVWDRRTPYTVEQMQMLGDLIKRFLEKQEK